MFSINITYNFLSFSMKPRVGLGREMEMEGCEAGEREQGGKLGRRGVHPILATPQASSSLSPAVTDINGLLVSNLFFFFSNLKVVSLASMNRTAVSALLGFFPVLFWKIFIKMTSQKNGVSWLIKPNEKKE